MWPAPFWYLQWGHSICFLILSSVFYLACAVLCPRKLTPLTALPSLPHQLTLSLAWPIACNSKRWEDQKRDSSRYFFLTLSLFKALFSGSGYFSQWLWPLWGSSHPCLYSLWGSVNSFLSWPLWGWRWSFPWLLASVTSISLVSSLEPIHISVNST